MKKRLLYTFILLMGVFVLNSCDSTNAPTKYQVTINANPIEGGTVSFNKSGKYPAGAKIRIKANPKDGWRFVKWSGSFTGTKQITTITVSGDMTVTAIFKVIKYPLTVNVTGEGSVKQKVVTEENADFAAGTKIKLTAVPVEGWWFVKWKGDLKDKGTTNPVTITMDGPKTAIAVFKKLGEGNALKIKVEGKGKVTQDPLRARYTDGAKVDLSAKATDNFWVFNHWSTKKNGNYVITSTKTDTTITMNADKQLKAVFQRGIAQKPLYRIQGGRSVVFSQLTNLLPENVTLVKWFFLNPKGQAVLNQVFSDPKTKKLKPGESFAYGVGFQGIVPKSAVAKYFFKWIVKYQGKKHVLKYDISFNTNDKSSKMIRISDFELSDTTISLD